MLSWIIVSSAMTVAGVATEREPSAASETTQAVVSSYLDNERYDEAIDAARRGLSLIEAEQGEGHPDAVPLLNDLARAYLMAGDAESSRRYYEQSLAITRTALGLFDRGVIESAFGLGKALQSLGRHRDAMRNFQNAQHVTHRHAGVHNLDQIPLIEATSRSLMATGQWEEAENLQKFAYKLYRRNYGEESVETLPGLYRLGMWYQRMQAFEQARETYRRALKLLAASNGGAESPDLIPALRGIAASYLEGDGASRTSGMALPGIAALYLEESGTHRIKGLRALSRVVAIVDGHADQFSQEQRIMAHLEIADWAVRYSHEKIAWSHLETAWRLSREETRSGRDWDAYFDQPHLITQGKALSMSRIGYGRVGDDIYYDFEFVVGRHGRPKYIEVVDTNLPLSTRRTAIGLLRGARFRPRLVDGQAVETPDYRMRREYPTYPPPSPGLVFRPREFVGID